jgi:hypothetical protein
MSEEDRSQRETEGDKAKSNEFLERVNEKGARLHDRISGVLGSPKGARSEEENDGEQDDEQQDGEGEEEGGEGEE